MNRGPEETGRCAGVLGLVPWGRGLLPVLVALFVVVRLGEAWSLAPGWMRGYGDDLLCLPLVLSLALTARRLSGGPGGETLPVSHGILAVVFFGLVFEVILPRTGAAVVSDPLDIVMYLTGFLIFQVGLNRPAARPDPLRAAGFVPTFPG